MKIHLINLDRAPERLQRMDGLLRSAGLDFRRIPAIDGRTLPPEEVRRHNRAAAEPLSAGEIGCFLSHRSAWQRIADGAEPYAAIIEDDLYFSDDAARFLADDGWIPADADIVKIETNLRRTTLARRRHALADGHFLALLHGHHFNTGGYIVSAGAARRLLDATARATMPVDELLFNPKSAVRRNLRVYQIVPALCIQHIMRPERAASPFLQGDIERGRTAVPRRGPGAKLKREVFRLANQIATVAAGHRLNAFSDRINMRVPFGRANER